VTSATPASPLRDALRSVVRTGGLSREEARGAFEAMLDGSEPISVAAAFLSALAVLGETPEILAGAVDVLRGRARQLPLDEDLSRRAVDVCGTGGDGLGTFNVSTATAFVVAGAGVPVAKHGGRAVSSVCGSADVLQSLGVDIEMPPERALRALRLANVTFLFAPLYHVAMKAVAPLRRELGIRTVFNLAGPLANPAGVRRQIVGVDRPERVGVLAAALAAVGAEHALVFSHEKGGDELLPFGVTQVAEVRGAAVRRFTLVPGDFGLAEGEPELVGGGSIERNAAILRGVLSGEEGSNRETVLMNAAAALVVGARTGDFRDGVALARRSIDGGHALASLERLVRISNGKDDAE
jgi:anthranilate phosphoribosyltransferase